MQLLTLSKNFNACSGDQIGVPQDFASETGLCDMRFAVVARVRARCNIASARLRDLVASAEND